MPPPKRKLSPAQQPKKRYLYITLIELSPQGIPYSEDNAKNEDPLSASEIQRSLNDTFLRLHGEICASKTHLKIIEHEYDSESNKHSIILRTTTETVNETRQTIAMLTSLSDRHNNQHYVIPELHTTSGVLKSLRDRMGLTKKPK
jgi:RNase P/RNase MRP subunit POP5